MSKYTDKQNLALDLLQTEHLLKLAGDHPLMSIGLKKKVAKLKELLNTFEGGDIEAKLSILFSGKAVSGSRGIKSSFISTIIRPIQDMIKAQTAEVKFQKIGRRGKVKGSSESEMFLTALPVGSFGIELSQLKTPDLFSELDVSNAIEQVVQIIKITTESDEGFATVVENSPSRILNNLKTFLKEVSSEDSIIKMHVNNNEVYIDKDHVKLGYLRVKAAEESQEEIDLNGVLRGLMLEANKFEFIGDDGVKYAGKISEDLESEDLVNFGKDYLNGSCRVQMLKTTVKLNGSASKVSYSLIGINQ